MLTWPRVLAACGVCAFLGAAAGRWTAPARVEERVRVEYRDRVVEKKVEVAVSREAASHTRETARVYHLHQETTRTTALSGETTEKTTTDVREGDVGREASTEAKEATAVRVEYRDRVVERVGETVRLAAPAPAWRFGVLAGADALGGLPPRWAFGGRVERRVAGPFSVGAWVLSSGTAGLSLSVDW